MPQVKEKNAYIYIYIYIIILIGGGPFFFFLESGLQLAKIIVTHISFVFVVIYLSNLKKVSLSLSLSLSLSQPSTIKLISLSYSNLFSQVTFKVNRFILFFIILLCFKVYMSLFVKFEVIG